MSLTQTPDSLATAVTERLHALPHLTVEQRQCLADYLTAGNNLANAVLDGTITTRRAAANDYREARRRFVASLGLRPEDVDVYDRPLSDVLGRS